MDHPYTCPWDKCSKVFARNDILTRHIDDTHEHASERPYRCPECERGFKQKGNMDVHIKSQHLNIKYPCKYCEWLCKSLSNRIHHEKTCGSNPQNWKKVLSGGVSKKKPKAKRTNASWRHARGERTSDSNIAINGASPAGNEYECVGRPTPRYAPPPYPPPGYGNIHYDISSPMAPPQPPAFPSSPHSEAAPPAFSLENQDFLIAQYPPSPATYLHHEPLSNMAFQTWNYEFHVAQEPFAGPGTSYAPSLDLHSDAFLVGQHAIPNYEAGLIGAHYLSIETYEYAMNSDVSLFVPSFHLQGQWEEYPSIYDGHVSATERAWGSPSLAYELSGPSFFPSY